MRSPSRATTWLVMISAACLGLLGSGAPASARPMPGLVGDGQRSPAMAVIAQNLEVSPNGTFSVYLRVTDAPANSDIAVDIYDPIADTADLVASATSTPLHEHARFDPFSLAADEVASQQTGFTISLYTRGNPRPPGAGPWAYRLDEPGVYPVRVRLRDQDGELLTSIVTYLVRTPIDTTAVTPARVALMTTVHQDADTSAAFDTPVSPTFTKALGRVLDRFRDHAALPASFEVTPETSVRLSDNRASATVLAALKAEASRPTRDLVGSPYVDLNPAQLVQQGLADEVGRQGDLGQRTLVETLGQPGSNTWVIDHHLDIATVDALRELGIAHLVVGPTALEGVQSAQPVLLPSAAGMNAVTTSAFDLRDGPTDDPVLAAYQLLGRLAAVGSLTPTGAGVVVRIDPETVDIRQLTTVLDTLAAPAVYLQPTTVTGLFQEVPTTTAPVASLARPTPIGLGSYPDQLRITNQMVASYGSMLGDPTTAMAAFEAPVATSAEDRLRVAQRNRILKRVQGQIQRQFNGITLPPSDHITLGARDARFPLPITSSAGTPLKVVITLEASDRLSFPQRQIRTTLGGSRTTVQVPVRTRATGDTPLRITVRTPDGLVILAESQYTIRSTAVSGVGLILTIGAGGFLALWWGRHWYRTRRRARTQPAEPQPGPPIPPPDGSDDADDIFIDSSM